MPFISYAQNNEDVLLWRALGHVPNGFYIDVGASDPVEHSVTKAFYDAGWRGINIEPLPAHIAAFDAERPGDVNLAIAAGAVDGELTLYDVPDVRGWASPDQAVAEMHRAEGHKVAELKVPVHTLASVCRDHVDGKAGAIHFLKIDVEGFEGEVLRGMDFERWRPWVLVVEATLPGSRESAHAGWEHLVTGQRYRFAWFDGLNRYYVADEHPELLAHFGTQPNVFDDYISHHLDKAWATGKRLQAQVLEQDAAGRQAAGHIVKLEAVHAGALREKEELALERDQLALDKGQLTAAKAQLALDKAQLETDAAALRATLEQVRDAHHKLAEWAGDLEQRLITAEAWIRNLQDELAAVYASTSWRISRPVRAAGSMVLSLRRPYLARRMVNQVTSNERIRRLVIPVLLRFPALNRHVSASLTAIKLDAPQQAVAGVEVPDELKGLPASARAVLADLRRARAHGN